MAVNTKNLRIIVAEKDPNSVVTTQSPGEPKDIISIVPHDKPEFYGTKDGSRSIWFIIEGNDD